MGKRINIKSIQSVDIDNNFKMTLPERDTESICWFKTAVLNYNTANILLNNKIVCHALFFMQQCVECVVKGILIENHIVAIGEIKNWNHSPENAFSELYRSFESQSEELFTKIKEKINNEHGLQSKLKITISIINHYFKVYEDSLNMTHSKIEPSVYLHLYVDVAIISLSVLLNCMQQNTRYPDIETYRLPTMVYDESEIVVEYTREILKMINCILNNVCPECCT